MPHEIMEHDQLVLNREQAWHGLGTIVEENLTPTEALRRCELDWVVTGQEVYRKTPDGRFVRIENAVCNTRMDVGETGVSLGIVSKNYERIQNETLAEFAEELAKTQQVTVETCGSIRNGARVWFLCKGEAFEIGSHEDIVFPYLLVSNGHDGSSSLRVTPTSVRVVCSNTLHMVIPERESRSSSFGIALKHTGNIMQRTDEVRAVLSQFHNQRSEFIDRANRLKNKSVESMDQLKGLFAHWWERDFRPLPEGELTPRQRTRANRIFTHRDTFVHRFEDEIAVSGANLWTAMNAYTGFLQHDFGRSDREGKVNSSLFGINAQRSIKTFASALALAS